MLDDLQIDLLCRQMNATESGRLLVRRDRTFDPARRVGGGRSNVCVHYPSRKMEFVVQAESHTVELALVYELEHDPEVPRILRPAGTPDPQVSFKKRKESWRLPYARLSDHSAGQNRVRQMQNRRRACRSRREKPKPLQERRRRPMDLPSRGGSGCRVRTLLPGLVFVRNRLDLSGQYPVHRGLPEKRVP